MSKSLLIYRILIKTQTLFYAIFMIPKIFHLTYKNYDLPQHFKVNLSRIEQLYPDHEIRIHDDSSIYEFAALNFPEYYESTFKNMPQIIMKVDTVRYMWMYIYGGIYCDFDIYFRKHIDFTQGAILIEREWTSPKNNAIIHSVHNCCFASEPGHPIWLKILEGIAKNFLDLNQKSHFLKSFKPLSKGKFLRRSKKTVFDLTGPNAISKIITEYELLKKHKDVTIMPGSVIYQKGRSKGHLSNAYVIHETASSWKE